MSTTGIYNYHPKVEHPNATFYQMASDTEQPSFFFGGSQVPVNLGIAHGAGLRTKHRFTLDDKHILSTQGRGIHTTVNKNDKIMMPKYMSGIKH